MVKRWQRKENPREMEAGKEDERIEDVVDVRLLERRGRDESKCESTRERRPGI